MNGELDPLLTDLRPPSPPPELRQKTLGAATEALLTPSKPNFWAQIYESRPLRLAWATTAVGLVLANALISIPLRPSTPMQSGIPLQRASRMADEEIRAITDLPRIDFEMRSLAAVVAAESNENPPNQYSKENA